MKRIPKTENDAPHVRNVATIADSLEKIHVPSYSADI